MLNFACRTKEEHLQVIDFIIFFLYILTTITSNKYLQLDQISSYCLYMKTTEKSYHISKGADDVYWILNHGESFVKNLSKDFDTAVAKAKEYVGDSDIPVDVWHRAKKTYDSYEYPIQQDSHVNSYYEYLYQLEFEPKKIECEARQFVGEVGSTLEMELELIETFSFESDYGYCKCYRFKDQNQNRFVYFGTSQQAKCFQNPSDKHIVSFEIKRQFTDHQHYQKDGVVPFKVNQITKLKTNAPKIKKDTKQFVKEQEVIA
jgi:hypothetical protein